MRTPDEIRAFIELAKQSADICADMPQEAAIELELLHNTQVQVLEWVLGDDLIKQEKTK